MDITKSTMDENVNFPYPRYNQNLYDQIKLCIITDYFPKTLSKMPKGTMEFFIRDGELAINYHTTKIRLSITKPDPIVNAGGMTRKKLLNFLMQVEESITSHPPIDYGSIIIDYEILENGEVDGVIEYKTQINHRRR